MKLLLRFLNWIGLTNLSREEARSMTGPEWKAANDMTELNRCPRCAERMRRLNPMGKKEARAGQ